MNKHSIVIPSHEREKELIFARRHWAVAAAIFVLVGIALLFPLILIVVIFTNYSMLAETLFKDIVVVLTTVYFLVLANYTLVEWLRYYYDILFCTDKFLIKVDQEGLVNRQITEIPLEKVVNISAHIRGFWPSFFLFGDIVVETAEPNRETIIFPSIGEPIITAEKILKAHNQIVEKTRKGKEVVVPQEIINEPQLVTDLEARPVDGVSAKSENPQEPLRKISRQPTRTGPNEAKESKKPGKSVGDIVREDVFGPAKPARQKKGKSVMEIVQEDTFFPPKQTAPPPPGKPIPTIFIDAITGRSQDEKRREEERKK